MNALMSFFKNEALLKLGLLAAGLIVLYNSLWNDGSSPPPTTPTPTIIEIPTPNPTEVQLTRYTCSEWNAASETNNIPKIFICYEIR